MKLKDLNEIRDLTQDLKQAEQVLYEFQNIPEDFVIAKAHTNDDLRSGPSYTVLLLPVAKHVAVSAAKRECSKIVDKLRSLGVDVD